jgi:hypothetical protein
MINNNLTKSIGLTALIVGLVAIFPHSADAYVDPNTGGFFFTSVLPFVYGILAAIVIFWKRIANTVKNIFFRKKENSDS